MSTVQFISYYQIFTILAYNTSPKSIIFIVSNLLISVSRNQYLSRPYTDPNNFFLIKFYLDMWNMHFINFFD